MKILITGGSGLIGRALTAKLVALGNRVFVLSRNPRRKVPVTAGIIPLSWERNDWQCLLGEIDAVVHLAGASLSRWPWTPGWRKRILQSRLATGKRLVEAIAASRIKPPVFIQASGIGYYGDGGDHLLDETSPAGSDFLADVARQWEDSSLPLEELGIRRVVLRSGLVLARGARILNLLLLPFRLFFGGRLGDGSQWLSWIHISDEVDAILFLLKTRRTRGAYNLCAPQPLSFEALGRSIAQVLARPYWFHLPAFLLKVVLGGMSALVLTGQRAVPARLLKAGYRFHFEDFETALRDLVR